MLNIDTSDLLQAAVAHHQAGQLAQAEDLYRQILARSPDQPEALHLLGVAAYQAGQHETAAGLIRRALAVAPQMAVAWNSLGAVLNAQGQAPAALDCYRRAIALQPDYADALGNLGISLADTGQYDLALPVLRRALQLRPAFPAVLLQLGVLTTLRGEDLDVAIDYFRQALRHQPDYFEALCNLGNALKFAGKIAESLACYRAALALRPGAADVHSNLILAMHYDPAVDPATLQRELSAWNQRHAQPLAATIRSHANDRSPDRPLRLGYVSGDFANHTAGYAMLPLLAAHDRTQFTICAYSSGSRRDEVTARLRSHCDVWHDVAALDDELLAQLIRADRIDILVDLSVHSAHNRLRAFARKPAPVQVTWLGYPGTTGLPAMDYRLTDVHLDPPGADASSYCEESIRLPESYWCYQPGVPTPPVGALPAAQRGTVCFGCLNHFFKLTPQVLDTWSTILHRVPGARLVLHAFPGGHRAAVLEFFAQRGIAAARIAFVGRLPMEAYFQQFAPIDIALDPFPYGGGITTCDTLWMGIPVVSLAGQTAVGRTGLSILSNIGLPELVAHSTGEYIHIAVALAADRPRLTQLRATLRQRMETAPLMDARRFARNIEATYRTLWRRWCQDAPATG